MYSLQNGALETLLDLHDKVQINSILCQTPNRIWVATEGNGLYLYDVKNKKLDNYRYENKLSCLNSNYVRSLALDQENRLWVGTYSGLNIYQEGKNALYRLRVRWLRQGRCRRTRCVASSETRRAECGWVHTGED